MYSIRFSLVYIAVFSYVLFLPDILLSQKKTVINDETERLVMAYTYYLAQNASLESVSERFPSQKENALNAIKEWKREFNPAIKKIDSCLFAIKGANWENEKIAIFNKYRRADHSNVSEKEAQKFINIIFQRSYGRIQSPVLETLLSYKPEYLDNPEKEFSDGFINSYFSAPPKKKASINIRIVYPSSWKAVSDFTQKNIQQIFISKYGAGNLSLSFLLERTNSLPIEKNPNLLSENTLKNYCLKTDSVLKFTGGLDLDQCSAACISYLRKETELDKKYYKIFETYHAYYKNYHFALIFHYKSDKQNFADIKSDFEKYRKLIRKILFNIVVVSQWEQKKM
jgi:hypothetical protein